MNSITITPATGDIDRDGYLVEGGGTVRREFGQTPMGNSIRGKWVYRDATGAFIDVDQYRNDLFERHNLREVL